MWTIFVLILPPVINGFPGVNDISEPVLIQTFIAKVFVKTLNKSVLSRPARLDKTQFHSMLKDPLLQCAASESGP